MPDVGDRLITDEAGRIIFDLDGILYNVSPLSALDANIGSCLAKHRDALLDVRLFIYGTSVSRS